MSFVLLFVLIGCRGNNVENLISSYYSEKLSDANGYSFNITKTTNIKNGESDYSKIIEYAENEFKCDGSKITDLKIVEVVVEADYGYTEEYTSYFIVGKVNGTLMIIDKDDGPWSDGFDSGVDSDGGYTVTFG